jgi:hypothetical protein
MAKICINPICEKEIPSSATFCSFCGAQQVENIQLSEEEKLRKEMNEAEKTIKILEKSLTDAHDKIENGTSNEGIQKLENQLANAQTKQEKLQNQIAEKNREIEQLRLLANRKKRNVGIIFFMIVFFLTTIGLGVGCLELNIELQEMESVQDDLLQTFPLKITRIELANESKNGTIIDDFGTSLYGNRLRYLKPKIYFKNYLKESKKFKFEIHYVDSWGRMEYNTSSGQVPSSENYISPYEDSKQLASWGNEFGGTWKSGHWTIEIWYNGVCLGSKKFTIN